MSFIIAAPASGSGKTTITLGLLRAMRRRGVNVRGAKSGPDYIDPQFHSAACAVPCFNLDAWAMGNDQLNTLAVHDSFQIIEGAMGLFDGAPPDGQGSSAHLARILGLPVVLVVDASSMSQSIAAMVHGFASHDPNIRVIGVILNKVGSPRHEKMLRHALATINMTVFGAIHRNQAIARPSRHLGLVQAGEIPDLETFLEAAADVVESSVDMDALLSIETTQRPSNAQKTPQAKETLAIARDAAFSFIYNHQIAQWEQSGVTINWFSPLADDHVPEADAIFLPGGYPELHAKQLSENTVFLSSLRDRAKDTPIRGECGGYMALGEVLTDAEGHDHEMAGLLPLHTSFANRKLHLGYRTLTNRQTGEKLKAHEFHYASTIRADGIPLYDATDAEGNSLGKMGLIEGHVSGSFAHLIV